MLVVAKFMFPCASSSYSLVGCGRLLSKWCELSSLAIFFPLNTVKSNDSGIQQGSDDGRESLPSTVSANSLYEPGEFS